MRYLLAILAATAIWLLAMPGGWRPEAAGGPRDVLLRLAHATEAAGDDLLPSPASPHATEGQRDARHQRREGVEGRLAEMTGLPAERWQMTTLVFDQAVRDRVAEGVIGTFNRLGLTVTAAAAGRGRL